MTALLGRRWSRFGAVLLTVAVLLMLLGLNVSASASWTSTIHLLVELFGLILLLDLVFAGVFVLLERGRFGP